MTTKPDAPPQAVVPYQALDFASNAWRLVTVKWQHGPRRRVASPEPAPPGWLGRWNGAAGSAMVLTLRHRTARQDITATFGWDGDQWICPDRGLFVDAAIMWTAIVRGFGGAHDHAG